MSHWGELSALNVIIYLYLLYNNIKLKKKEIRDIKNIVSYSPLPLDFISIIYGSLLGDGHGEKRYNNARFSFYQENVHDEYLLYLHRIVSNLGYCNPNIPKCHTRLGKKGKIRKTIRFHTWSLNQFNWIYHNWYINGKKCLPVDLEIYLTPLALAIWIMDDGGKVSNGLKIATNCFTYKEQLRIIEILKNRYGLHASIISAGDYKNTQYNIYISAISIKKLYSIVQSYIVPSMKYKFNI